MKNRQQRRAEMADVTKSIRKGEWGSWEDRSHLRGHALAVPGLKRAVLNKIYSVQFFEQDTGLGTVLHLMVRRHDGAAVCSWPDLQRIKDELCGPQRVAVQIHPKASELVDEANMYHLWVLPVGQTLPFGMK